MRTDNIGVVRIHLGEVPDDLQDRIHVDDVQPELHAAALADEVLSLEKSQSESAAQRIRLEELIIKQGTAITRYSQLLDKSDFNTKFEAPPEVSATVRENLAQRDSEVEKLTNILDRTFRAIDTRDRQVATQTDQLTGTADKAINLLERALREGEISTERLHSLNQQISTSANTSGRLEKELDERNSVINNQNTLMERLVAVTEQSVAGSSIQKRRKRSFWQRLFGGGTGI